MTEYVTPPTHDVTGNPFTEAGFYTEQTSQFVFDQMAWTKVWADEQLGEAVSRIEEIVGFPETIPLLPPDTVPFPNLDTTPDWSPIALDPVDATSFGSIDAFPDTTPPEVSGLPSISAVVIPEFEPSIVGLAIPEAPVPAYVPPPDDAPESPGFTYPVAPVITLPDMPALNNVVIPSFIPPVLPEFDATFPTFQSQAIDTFINWTEPTYTPEILSTVMAQITTFLAGGSGINPVVEEAIYARGRDREDRAVFQQEQQATDEWAGRGYTAPPGMLVQRLDSIREEGLLKKLGLNRDIVIKVHETEIENLRFAVQQGIAAEQFYVTMFMAANERLFEVQKLHVQWGIELYNLQVTIFNAQMQEVAIRVQVYETQIRTKLAEIEVYKALIEGERVKAEVNKVLIEAYTAEIQARESMVKIYEAQVRAVGVQATVFESEITAYRGTVEAYAARVGADKLRFDAYDSRVKGELGKASILDAEARAYQSQIQGIGIGVQAETAALEGEVSRIRAEIEAYVAGVNASSEKGRIQLAQLQGNVAGYTANTQRFIAQAAEEEAKAKVDLAGWETENRIGLSFFEAQIERFKANQQTILEQAKIALAALTSAAEISSTIGAGAMAAMHVGATLNGSSGISASGTDSASFSHSLTRSFGRQENSSISVDAAEDFLELDPNV